jgi:uncharacterized integral membrane protein (TIGR00698 family)
MLTALLACAAMEMHSLPGLGIFSPLILAIFSGMAFQNVIGTPPRAQAGIAFSMRRILRLGIILLGLQLTAAQVLAVGVSGIAIIVATLIATFTVTKGLGRLLRVEPKLTELIAAGTSICGASAIIATNTVTRAEDEDVAYAVACVTVFGSAAMFLYPLLGGALALSSHDYGLWTGASIHEIAQVVAAAYQRGSESGEFGTVAKLTRVMMLAPMILTLGWVAARKSARKSNATEDGPRSAIPMPWFVLGFLALVGLNSLVTVTPVLHGAIVQVTNFLLAMALAAMGLAADFRKLKAKGAKPLLLAALAWIFIAGFSLALVMLAR